MFRLASYLCSAFVLSAPMIAKADFERGQKAYEAWDTTAAVAEYSKTAATDGRSAYALAMIYWNRYYGQPAERLTKYDEWMDKALKLENPDAQARYGESQLRDSQFAGPVFKATEETASKGVELLKASCARQSVAGCRALARVYGEGLKVGGLSIEKNPAEAKAVGETWEKAVFSATGLQLFSNLSELSRNRFASLDQNTRIAYFVVANRRWGLIEDQIAFNFYGQSHPQGLAKEEFKAGVMQADILERRLGLVEEKAPSLDQVMVRIVDYFSGQERANASRLRTMSQSVAATLVAEAAADRLKSEGWDTVFGKATGLTLPVLREYLIRREKLLEASGLDVRSWLNKSLRVQVSERDLRFVDSFLRSTPGKKYVQFNQMLESMGAEANVIGARLRVDPAMAHYGNSLNERLIGFAASKKIALEPNQDDMAARDRAQNMRLLLSQRSGMRSLVRVMQSDVLLRLLGDRYDQVDKLIHRSEWVFVRQAVLNTQNTSWSAIESLLAELDTQRQKNGDVINLDKALGEAFDPITQALR